MNFGRAPSRSLSSGRGMKTYIRSPRNKSTFLQPLWLCLALFIVLLLAAQGVQSFFLLRMFWELEAVKHRHTDIFRSGTPQSSISNGSANGSSEEPLQYGMNNVNFLGDEELNFRSSHPRNISLWPRVKQLENKVKFLELYVSLKNTEEKALQSQHAKERNKFSDDTRIRALENQLHNVTEALKTLEKRLEEGLDANLLQISQLKDDFYFIENYLNLTDKEHFHFDESSTLPHFSEIKKIPSTTGLPSADFTAEEASRKESVTIFGSSNPQKTAEAQHKIKIPFIKNRADFQVFFYGADKDASGHLTYAELMKVLGEDTPKEDDLQMFDGDNNQMYSYLELMNTFELAD
ncbi:hypothetical protein NDU88_004668 [Pleurodeles waltl]|uniref:EF-hand domain-containing protein n=1 Tax=Pleurodeles waltl TaxID=8319 RepID=A0AAV7WXA4_PLEWA|nr:hypothetical protein NDU88_004668 [Pleurodeles waltl]